MTTETTDKPRRGRPVGSGRGASESIIVRLPPEVLAKAGAMAQAAGLSRNLWIENLIKQAKQ